MSDFEDEMNRLTELDTAVRNYLSHLYAFEQGAEHDGAFVEHWREQLDLLTSGECAYETFGGARFDMYGRPLEDDALWT